jgi:hypothetical protein
MDLAPALYKSYTIFLTETSDVTNQLHTALKHLVSEIHSYLHQHVSFPTSLIIHTTGTVLLLLLLLLYVPDDQLLCRLIGFNVHKCNNTEYYLLLGYGRFFFFRADCTGMFHTESITYINIS